MSETGGEVAGYPDDLRDLVEVRLAELEFSARKGTDGLQEAMRYSLLAGGKRVRPVLSLATARALGYAPEAFLDTAAATELIHTYSLIHDDLPAMDDDELRRGMPTSHIRYGEDVAILAGDGLFAEAVKLFCAQAAGIPAGASVAGTAGAGAAGPSAERVLAALGELAGATGVDGMVGGQYIDVSQAAPGAATLDAAGLQELHRLKTGRLIAASIGVILELTGTPATEQEPYRRFAAELGILFQIVDDILDVVGEEASTGKSRGSDQRHGKLTYASLFGMERAHELATESLAGAERALAETDAQTDDLARITRFIHARQT